MATRVQAAADAAPAEVTSTPPPGDAPPPPSRPSRPLLNAAGDALASVLPFVVFAAAVAVLLWPALAGGAITLPHDLLLERPPWEEVAPADVANRELGDVVNSVYPTQRTLLRRLAAGQRSDLLDDVSLGVPGVPFIAWGALSPFNLLPVALPYDVGWDWSMALRLFTAMAGAHLFARSYGISRAGGTVCGLAFGLSGYMVGWLGWPQSHVGAFIPWVALWARRSALADAPWWAPQALALATAGLWLGGFPAVSAWALIAAGVVALHAACSQDARVWHRRPLLLLRPLLGVVAGTGLVAFTMLPSLSMAADFALSYRENMSRARIPVQGLPTFVVPKVFGDVVTEAPWIGSSYVETVGYAGVTTLVLAAVALCVRPRPRGTWLALLTAAGFGMLAYGAGPLPQLVGALPLLRQHAPARVLVVVGLFLALLGGFGLDAASGWVRRRRRADWPVTAAVVAVLTTGGVVIHALVARRAAMLDPLRAGEAVDFARSQAEIAALLVGALVLLLVAFRLLRDVLPPAVGTTVVVALVALDMVGFAAPWNTQSPQDQLFPSAPGIARAVRASADGGRIAGADQFGLPNTHLVHGYRDIRARAFYTERHRELLDRLGVRWLSNTWFDLDSTGSGRWQPWLSVMGVEGVLTTAAVDDVGSVVVRPERDDVLTPLTPGVSQTVTVQAPRAGRLDGVLVHVGTYGRNAEGALAVEVATGSGAPESDAPESDAPGSDAPESDAFGAGRRSAATVSDLSWAAVPLDAPVTVQAGEELTVRLSGTAPAADRALSLFGQVQDGAELPALALLYDDVGLEAEPLGGGVRFIANPHALPPVVAMGTAVGVPPGQALDAVAEVGAEDLTDVAVVDRPPGGFGDPLPQGGHARITASSLEPGDIRARVRATGDGAVVAAVAQHLTGWRAYVDGAEVPLLTVDHVLLGTRVPAGVSEVRFLYTTPLWDEGRMLSAAAALVLVGAGLAERLRRRRSADPGADSGADAGVAR